MASMRQPPNGKSGMRGRSGDQRQRGRPRNQQSYDGPRNQFHDSNGPGVRVRGKVQQVVRRYQSLAREAAAQGDRILCESYLQHAEHYLRIVPPLNHDAFQRGTPLDRGVTDEVDTLG